MKCDRHPWGEPEGDLTCDGTGHPYGHTYVAGAGNDDERVEEQ